jgi:hypothetical protein
LHDTYLKGFIDMHIIFGDAVKEIPDSFTILELDTFKLTTENQTATAFCVVEKIPLAEFTVLAANKELHSNLIRYYRQKQWKYCEQAIAALIGKWNGELDSFYSDLLSRINELKKTELDESWQGFVER